MGKFYTCFFWIFCFGVSFSQQTDSIYLDVKLDSTHHELQVKQEFVLVNQSQKTLTEVYLHAWANAYSGKLTVLNKVKLQDRKGALHFSEREERGGVDNLIFTDFESNSVRFQINEREFIRIPLEKPWKKGEIIRIKAEYTVKIPFDAVTRYGRTEKGNYLLKYFFLQPATLNANGNWVLQHYKDFEGLSAYPSY